MPSSGAFSKINNRRLLCLIIAFVVLAISATLAMAFGSSRMELVELWSAIHGDESAKGVIRILHYVRLPRMLAAILSGSALAVSGAIIQVTLGNPLAGPNVIGLNAGAGFCVLIASALCPAMPALAPAAAFAGALISSLVVLGIARLGSGSRLTVVLSGIAVTGIFTAGMNLILIIYPDAYVGSGTFLAGGLASITMPALRYPAMAIVPGLILALLLSRSMNILALGQDRARALGMNVGAYQIGSLMLAALLAGAAVSFAGLIGFVGLLAPHIARFFVGHDNRFVIPFSALLGAIFVTLCDVGARVLFYPYELPVGILLSLFGGPFFIFLILKNRRQTYD